MMYVCMDKRNWGCDIQPTSSTFKSDKIMTWSTSQGTLFDIVHQDLEKMYIMYVKLQNFKVWLLIHTYIHKQTHTHTHTHNPFCVCSSGRAWMKYDRFESSLCVPMKTRGRPQEAGNIDQLKTFFATHVPLKNLWTMRVLNSYSQ